MADVILAGTLIPCNNIIFKEDGRADMKKCHPGITIIPTGTDDDKMYCLYMTSDYNRAKRDPKKFMRINGNTGKTSYINLEQVIEINNSFRHEFAKIPYYTYIEILKRFQKYQLGKGKMADEEFEKIKDPVKLIIEINDLNDQITSLDYNTEKIELTADNIKELCKCKNDEMRREIIIAKMLRRRKEGYAEISKALGVSEKNIKQLVEQKYKFEEYIYENKFFDEDKHGNNPEGDWNLENYYFNIKSNAISLDAEELLERIIAMTVLNERDTLRKKKIQVVREMIGNIKLKKEMKNEEENYYNDR